VSKLKKHLSGRLLQGGEIQSRDVAKTNEKPYRLNQRKNHLLMLIA
jgi:hypothetical protein